MNGVAKHETTNRSKVQPGWWSNLCIYFSFVGLYHSAPKWPLPSQKFGQPCRIDHPCCQYPMTWMVDKTIRVRWHFPMTQVSSLSHPSRSPTFRDGVSFFPPEPEKTPYIKDRSIYLPGAPPPPFWSANAEWLGSPEASDISMGNALVFDDAIRHPHPGPVPWVYPKGAVSAKSKTPNWQTSTPIYWGW